MQQDGFHTFAFLQERLALSNEEVAKLLGYGKRQIVRWRTEEAEPPKPVLMVLTHLYKQQVIVCEVKGVFKRGNQIGYCANIKCGSTICTAQRGSCDKQKVIRGLNRP